MASISVPLSWPHRQLRADFSAYWLLLVLVSLLVLLPVTLILIGSFQVSGAAEPIRYGLDAWTYVLSTPTLLASIWNTFTVALARQTIAFVIAVPVAWILARTDIPGSRWLEFLFWIGFFVPALPVTLGWIMLLDPHYGLLNRLLTSLPFVHEAPFNIYSFWGIVWAHLTTSTIAIKVMLLTPAFRNLDATLEEASLVSGSGPLGTLTRVVIPIMVPVLSVVLLLSLVHSLQAFELEMILGRPFHFFVFSTQVYILLHQQPANFAAATALSSMVLGIMIPLIAIQRWAMSRRRYTTVTGQFKSQKMRLRAWRLPIFVMVLGLGMLLTAVPFVLLIIATLMRMIGFFDLPQPWTTDHWARVFTDPIFLRSVRDTILLAGATALVVVVLSTMIAYIIMRTAFAARAAFDFISWLPATLPGIIVGLGLVWAILQFPPLRPLYGTIILMVLATVIATMTTAVQILKANFSQLGFDLEEAGRVGGGSWWQSFRYVLLPLMMPTLLLVGALSFISAARNVSTVALVATSGVRPLSLLQLDLMMDGRYESAAVVGVLVVLLTTGIALIARTLGLRLGVGQD